MAVIIKCNRIERLAAPERIVVEAPRRTAYPQVGERAFIWTSESRGGEGLVAAGVITTVGPGNHGSTRLTIAPDGRPIANPLGKNDLKPHRDASPGSPLVGIARKLYRDSLTKIATLGAEEEEFLNGHLAEGKMVTPEGRL